MKRLAEVPPAWAAAGLLTLFTLQAGVAATLDSPTSDEFIHLHAGLEALRKGDLRYDTEHPPLARIWAAAPAALFGLESPAPSYPALRAARVSTIVLGVLLGLILYVWARALWGSRGAVISLFLYSLSPTLLAHTHLVTTDLGAGFGYVLSLWLFWRFCEKPTPVRCALAGLGLGAALLMKFSALLLLPILAVLGIWKLARERGRPARALLAAELILFLAGLVLWAGHGFRDSAGPAGQRLDWSELKATRTAGVMQRMRILPEAYRHGIARVSEKAARTTYLNGEIHEGGRRLYFPEAFLLKTPPALLALLGWLAWNRGRRPEGRSRSAAFLAVPVAVYAATALIFPLNIGHRHLLPLYPILFLTAGSAIGLAESARTAKLLAALLAAFAISSLSAFPRHLAYFNLLAGGTANGWRFLADSNLDWGQDLDRLRPKMREHRLEAVYLAYFGPADPGAHGIAYRRTYTWDNPEHGIVELPKSGDVLAISVNALVGVVRGWPMDTPHDGLPPFHEWRQSILKLTPFDRAGDSIFLYRIP